MGESSIRSFFPNSKKVNLKDENEEEEEITSIFTVTWFSRLGKNFNLNKAHRHEAESEARH